MSKKRGLQRRSDIFAPDYTGAAAPAPARSDVDAVTSDQDRREHDRHLTKTQRKKARHDRKRTGARLNAPISDSLYAFLGRVAQRVGVPKNNLVEFLIVESVNRARQSGSVLRSARARATGGVGARYRYDLRLPSIAHTGKDRLARRTLNLSSATIEALKNEAKSLKDPEDTLETCARLGVPASSVAAYRLAESVQHHIGTGKLDANTEAQVETLATTLKEVRIFPTSEGRGVAFGYELPIPDLVEDEGSWQKQAAG